MQRLVHVLGDPQLAYPVIHVTGTNGKGSTTRMITALLAEAGLSVGTYTSPHLQRLNERISRNGEPIDDDSLAQVLSDLEQVAPVAGVESSWFELITAAALRWFADVAVDVAVVEVGLLGRWDATNVCDGVVAVLTNVGHDHSDFGPGWRVAVAEEKAGIVKPGVTDVFVLGETEPELLPVFGRATEGRVAIWHRDADFGCESNTTAVGGRLVDLRTPSGVQEEVFVSLHGAHQGDNAACALAAAEAFFGSPLSPEVVQGALGTVSVPGRFEVVGQRPLIVLDGAHNYEGAGSVVATLDEDFAVDGERIIVTGALAPRDPEQLLSALEVERAAVVVATTAPSPRAIEASVIAEVAERLGAPAVAEPDVARAVERAKQLATEDDAILVTGSLYVVGAARTHLVGPSGAN